MEPADLKVSAPHSDLAGRVTQADPVGGHPLTPGERKLVTRTFNQTAHHMPGARCLPDLLMEQVRKQPDRTAVVHDHERLTFRELAERSTDLALHLRQLGVAVDECVGMFMEPSTDLIVGAWGILSAGGAYLPLSPEYPEERVRSMIEDSRCRIVLTQAHLASRVAELVRPGTRIGTPQDARRPGRRGGGGGRGRLAGAPSPDSLAYVVYTSGSTGEPKGVMIEHRSIVNQLRWLQAVQGLDQRRIVLQKTPIGFDAAQWEILASACGSQVVIAGAGAHRDPERLVGSVIRHGVTTLQCVPTLLKALVETDALDTCTSLSQIFSGGEALSKALARQCLELLGTCELVNLYGPTECTINSSAFTVDRASLPAAPQTISIGSPVHNTQYYILDPERSPVGVGDVGELYIGGVQVARGYLRRPDLTRERFVDNPFRHDHGSPRLYRTGDLAYWNADGTVQFVGRVDNQVKLRGFRVELDEIRLAIEAHDWVKNAAVVVRTDTRTGYQKLIAFVELSPREAALMDQGSPAAHHLSKESRLQSRAQLSNAGCRDAREIAGKAVVEIPGKTPTAEQRRRVFARKTYRFFEGADVTRADILRVLGTRAGGTARRSLGDVTPGVLGHVLRYFGQYHSAERLLPKYGYASPGALYATQMYLEVEDVAGLEAGYYYYHPVRHQLVLIRPKRPSGSPRIHVHFVGKRRAIEPVYKNNIREVLEIEAGHMVGLFEAVLPEYGLDIAPVAFEPALMTALECAPEDYYLGTFGIAPWDGTKADLALDVYVQAHAGRIPDLPAGLYRHAAGDLRRVSDEVVLRRHVVAINQEVYERASFGLWLISRTRHDWVGYVDLGRKLHRLQSNGMNVGFMSSGYSSKTGNDLPSAKRIEDVLQACGAATGPSYFVLGGRVSDEQVRSTGMNEDAVHMRGPTEMIRDDLARALPDYMLPSKVVLLDRLPRTANGKIDARALETLQVDAPDAAARDFVAPRTGTERAVARIWKSLLKCDRCSVHDDFFESGGNSLIAIALVRRINNDFGCSLPQQVLFESPTVEQLARRVARESGAVSSRLILLREQGSRSPVYLWPGLGGYPMNLRLLASRIDLDRPVYGVQAHGVNDGERPYASFGEIAAEDVELIRRHQPAGPYRLWGYSFGARIAYEVARQLEESGERVDRLFLVAPGLPRIEVDGQPLHARVAAYSDRAYVAILLSVFAGRISTPLVEACWRAAADDETFAAFVCDRFDHLDHDLVKRIVTVVHKTFGRAFDLKAVSPARQHVDAPVTVFRARGDERSFIEEAGRFSARSLEFVDLEGDHYAVLRDPSIEELVGHITRLDG